MIGTQQHPDERRPPLTPQLAKRVAVLGGFALLMFAIIFFRLWFLQVLSGQQYLAQASTNRTRTIAIPAPRGDILDSSGSVLVASKQSIAVQIAPQYLPARLTPDNLVNPPHKDMVVYNRLAGVLGMSRKPSKCPIVGLGKPRLADIPCLVAQQQALAQYANVTIKTGVSADVHYYLAEREQQFPGVQVQKVYLRNYPLDGLAAQLFGTIGPITQSELKLRQLRGVSRQAVIGQSGLEAEYDRYLRGRTGSEKVQVDALGRFTKRLKGISPVAGYNLRLSLNKSVQRVGQAALGQSIASNPPANGGAFVAMNPANGEIYAMGSLPTFNPNIFAKPFLPQAVYNRLNNKASGYPLINRAIESAGPTGSTFKPITATAALESGEWTTSDIYDDTGGFSIDGEHLHNSGHAIDGSLNLVDAIRVSSDDFFYNLGARTNVDPVGHPGGGPLQHWAHLYGIGVKTGVDLPGELAGTLPTPEWRESRNKLEAECDRATGPFKGKPKHSPGGCGIADGTDRPWSIGDNVNLAVGQGDVQVTPLQLATAYAALANGGTVVRPHIGLDAESANGVIKQKFSPPPTRHININPEYRATILEGLREAASQPGGTSAAVFSNFPEQVYGKTGTAQYNGQQDYAWYACFVPPSATSKPIVVVVTVEQGGFGAVGAAPVAREILSQWFFHKPGPYQAGTSQTL